MNSKRRAVIFCDGASRGNPGEAGAGVAMWDESGESLGTVSLYLGRRTNNQAEYRGAIAALEAALGVGAREVVLNLDSELVVRQLSGRYRVRNPRLMPLHKRILDLRSRFQRVTVRHVPREQNRVADRLANEALDCQTP